MSLRHFVFPVEIILPLQGSHAYSHFVSTFFSAECTPAEAVLCDEGECAPGESGYTCGQWALFVLPLPIYGRARDTKNNPSSELYIALRLRYPAVHADVHAIILITLSEQHPGSIDCDEWW